MEEYKVIEMIGDGTYGIVSKAINVKTNEVVAIKKMKKKFLSWEECIKLREVKSLRKLNHPNIIRLKEVIRVNAYLHLIFEFAENNLYQLMKERVSQFTESEIKSIIQQILLGVAYIHKNGFFHRDLKPENLMVNASPIGSMIKICDFGQAREIRSTPPYTEYIATRWYRAPECLLRSNVYSSPVDIFALGCIMAELYLRRPLFPGTSESDQLFKICSMLGTPTASTWPEGLRLGAKIGYQFPNFVTIPLSSFIPNANKEAIDLITAMLQFDPQKRITAAEALAHSYFASLPAKSIILIERKSSKRIPEFSAIMTEALFGRDRPPERKKEYTEKDSDSSKSITKYSLNDSLDSANHSKGFHKDSNKFLKPESLAKSSRSHNKLPQADLDDISAILDDNLYNPSKFKNKPIDVKDEKKSSRFIEEDKKSTLKSHSMWEDKFSDIGIISEPVKRQNEPVNDSNALSNESNFSYHKKHLGIGRNANVGIARAGLRAGIRDTYKKDAPLTDIYGIDSSKTGRKIEENLLYTPYDQLAKSQLNYGRYKHQ